MDDEDFHRWRAMEEVKRDAGSDLLAHLEAQAERKQSETEQLLERLTAGLDDTTTTEEER